MKIKSLLILAGLAIAGTTALAHDDHSAGEQNLAGRPGDRTKVVRTVHLVASEIRFDAKKLSFKKGEIVKFVLVNEGEQDHELTIGDAAYQLNHRKEMAEMAEATDASMNGMAAHHHNDGSTITVKPGETKELVWQFTNAGAFEFACNIPGHAEAGMAGTITIR
ncbi:MAG: multicopper oxidase domain-containing protein [Alphaproteobacteria bacterium]|nr:multicopper oxidase domain-containing protein [Alphaproteobacteria bacterium]